MLGINDNLLLLQLLGLADSVFPVGGLAHSYGLEALVAAGTVTTANLQDFLDDWCAQALVLDSTYGAAAHRLAQGPHTSDARITWERLNHELSALKPGRESRVASLKTGQRFLHLATRVSGAELPFLAAEPSRDTHLALAFGIVAGALGLPLEPTILGFLNQSVTGLVSAAQRLLPVGQIAAMEMLFRLKPLLANIARQAINGTTDAAECFQPHTDIATMRHPYLEQRMFLS